MSDKKLFSEDTLQEVKSFHIGNDDDLKVAEGLAKEIRSVITEVEKDTDKLSKNALNVLKEVKTDILGIASKNLNILGLIDVVKKIESALGSYKQKTIENLKSADNFISKKIGTYQTEKKVKEAQKVA